MKHFCRPFIFLRVLCCGLLFFGVGYGARAQKMGYAYMTDWNVAFHGSVSCMKEYAVGSLGGDTTFRYFDRAGRLLLYRRVTALGAQHVYQTGTDAGGNVWPLYGYRVFMKQGVEDTVWHTRYVLDSLGGKSPAILYELEASGDTLPLPESFWIQNGRITGREDRDTRQWFTWGDSLGGPCCRERKLYKSSGIYSGSTAFYRSGTGLLARLELESRPGVLFRTLVYNELGEPISGSWEGTPMLQFTYVTDPQGNWIERNRHTVLPGREQRTETLRREITYFE